MTYDEFKTITAEMRRWQKNYFRNRDKQALNRSKSLEKQVDEELNKTANPELFE